MTSNYYFIDASANFFRFDFDSVGPRGIIPKAVDYTPIPSTKNMYNLAFGDVQADGTIDDITVSNNGDMEMVLSTVAQTAILFLRNNPGKGIFFTGSTNARTRLYQMAIVHSLDAMNDEFVVLGVRNEVTEQFVTDVSYEAFLVFTK